MRRRLLFVMSLLLCVQLVMSQEVTPEATPPVSPTIPTAVPLPSATDTLPPSVVTLETVIPTQIRVSPAVTPALTEVTSVPPTVIDATVNTPIVTTTQATETHLPPTQIMTTASPEVTETIPAQITLLPETTGLPILTPILTEFVATAIPLMTGTQTQITATPDGFYPGGESEFSVQGMALRSHASPTQILIDEDGDTGVRRLIQAIRNTQTTNEKNIEITLKENGNYPVQRSYSDFNGPTGFPAIAHGVTVTIHGRGSRIYATDEGYRLFGVDNAYGRGTLHLDHLTLANGHLKVNGGGAIVVVAATASFDHVIFENNRTTASGHGHGLGGAIYNYGGIVRIQHSKFIRNSAREGSAIYGWRTYRSSGQTVIESSDFSQSNSPIIGRGGNQLMTLNGNWWGQASGPQPDDVPAGVTDPAPAPGPIRACPEVTGDSDGDCLSDAFETRYHSAEHPLNINSQDSDGNGIPDRDEDFDGDGLTNYQEQQAETSPVATDSDSDGMPDAFEVQYGLNPADASDATKDPDGDGLTNLLEFKMSLNPTTAKSDRLHHDMTERDYDGDGLTNAHELRKLVKPDTDVPYYNVLKKDSDGDGTADGAEDLDEDGLSNEEELKVLLNPVTQASYYEARKKDSDENGISDGDEDVDEDGLTNYEELRKLINESTQSPYYNATSRDSDKNGVADGDEDIDEDGLTNAQELRKLIDPDTKAPYYDALKADSDGNGISDSDEDADGDNLSNEEELKILLNSINGVTYYDATKPDSDENGTPDGDEDVDEDGLTNAQELRKLINPDTKVPYYDVLNRDSNGNGTSDGDEDYDSDRLTNYEELHVLKNPAGVFPYDPLKANTDGAGDDQDGNEDPDGDGLRNWQEMLLHTDAFSTTDLGEVSLFDTHATWDKAQALADGEDRATLRLILRPQRVVIEGRSYKRFLPDTAITWQVPPELNVVSKSARTDDYGQAQLVVTSTHVGTFTIRVQAGSQTLTYRIQFTGGDAAIQLTTVSEEQVRAGDTVYALLRVENKEAIPLTDVRVRASIQTGKAVIVSAEGASELSANQAVWTIPSLAGQSSEILNVQLRTNANLTFEDRVNLYASVFAAADRDIENNQTSRLITIIEKYSKNFSEHQANKLQVDLTASPTQAYVGQAVMLNLTITNSGTEALHNVSAFMPLLGKNNPNVALTWPHLQRPGYLGAGESAGVTIPFVMPADYIGDTIQVWVRAIDSDPADDSPVMAQDTLTASELSLKGIRLQQTLSVDPSGPVKPGDTVTFTLTLKNTGRDAAGSITIDGPGTIPAPIADLGANETRTISIPYTIQTGDVPLLLARFTTHAQGTSDASNVQQVSNLQKLRVQVNDATPEPGTQSADLSVDARAIAYLKGDDIPLVIQVRNTGSATATGINGRLILPQGLSVKTVPSGMSYDSGTRTLTFSLADLTPNKTHSPIVDIHVSDTLAVGMVLPLDVVVSTTSPEQNYENNAHLTSARIEVPAVRSADLTAVDATGRNWLVADGNDQIQLRLTTRDQLNRPIANIPFTLIAVDGIRFDGAPATTGADGTAVIPVRSSQVATDAAHLTPVVITVQMANNVQTSLTVARRPRALQWKKALPTPVDAGSSARAYFDVTRTHNPERILEKLTYGIELPAGSSLQRDWFSFNPDAVTLQYGQTLASGLMVTIPVAQCDLSGQYDFTLTATDSTGQVMSRLPSSLSIQRQTPQLTQSYPPDGQRVSGSNVTITWQSDSLFPEGKALVHYRQQGTTAYTSLLLKKVEETTTGQSGYVYQGTLTLPETNATETRYEWYGTFENSCAEQGHIGTETTPQTVLHVKSVSFVERDYRFTVGDGYNMTHTIDGQPMQIQVQNDSAENQQLLLKVENPYTDLILGFVGAGSIDQVLTLSGGQTTSLPLQVFTQEVSANNKTYTLMLALYNGSAEIVDRIPLTVEVKIPEQNLQIEILSVDDRSLVTRARLTNVGADITNLNLVIRDQDGNPVPMVIQPDIQHSYLKSGESVEIALVPTLLETPAPPQTHQVMTRSMTTSATDGDDRWNIQSVWNGTFKEVPLSGGYLRSSCAGNAGTEGKRTIAHQCQSPAGTQSWTQRSWYCTNKPDIDVPMTMSIPSGMPITNMTVSASFSPGGYGDVYNHDTTVSFNNAMVGNARVPQTSQISNDLPTSVLMRGNQATQMLNVRSTHTNDGHYTIASGFTVTLAYDAYTRNACFSQAELDAAAGKTLYCDGTSDGSGVDALDDVFQGRLPKMALGLIIVDSDGKPVQNPTPEVGETIPIQMNIYGGGRRIWKNVRLELTVPKGLKPQKLRLTGNAFLDDLLNEFIQHIWLPLLGTRGADENPVGLKVEDNGETSKLIYTYAQLPPKQQLNLDVVGELPGNYTIKAEVFHDSAPATPTPTANNTLAMRAAGDVQPQQQPTETPVLATTETINVQQSNGDDDGGGGQTPETCSIKLGKNAIETNGQTQDLYVNIYKTPSENIDWPVILISDNITAYEQFPDALLEADITGRYLTKVGDQATDKYWYRITWQVDDPDPDEEPVGWISQDDMSGRNTSVEARSGKIDCLDNLPDQDRDGSDVFALFAYPYSVKNLLGFLAPVTGNPVINDIKVDSKTILRIRAYSLNSPLEVEQGQPHLENGLWLKIHKWDRKSKPQVLIDGWVLVSTSDDSTDDITVNGETLITMPALPLNNISTAITTRPDVIQLPRETIQKIVDTVEDKSSDYGGKVPLSNQIDQDDADVPDFSFLPVSWDKWINGSRKELYGMGLLKPGGVTNYPPWGHPGVDFFVPDDSHIYSVADNGIVVGIGISKNNVDNSNSLWAWGGTKVDDDAKGPTIGYSVIIRHKNFYLQYGHLKELSPDIFVGAPINAGQMIGKIGQFNEAHLHLEIRRFEYSSIYQNASVNLADVRANTFFTPGATLGFLSVNMASPENNRLDFPPHRYDVTQLFNPDGIHAWRTDADIDVEPQTKVYLKGLNYEFQNAYLTDAKYLDENGKPKAEIRIENISITSYRVNENNVVETSSTTHNINFYANQLLFKPYVATIPVDDNGDPVADCGNVTINWPVWNGTYPEYFMVIDNDGTDKPFSYPPLHPDCNR